MGGWAARLVGEADRRTLALSALYFLLLLLAYYILRPLRDALAATIGAGTIKYLSSAVFIAMLALVPLFGWLVARLPRRPLLRAIHLFLIANLVLFAAAFYAAPEARVLACAFYVWVTVFNLFIVSVFWSFMADIWREDQSRRLFGVISAGGSVGGLIGPLATRSLVGVAGTAGMIGIAALVFAAGATCLLALERRVAPRESRSVRDPKGPLGGSPIDGVTALARSPFVAGIAALVIGGAVLGMFVYIEMARLVAQALPTTALRAAYFSGRDLWVNALACLVQFGILARLTGRLGIAPTLVLAALLAGGGFAAVAFLPTLAVLTIVNVLLRVTEFGLAKPSRDMLYTVVDARSRYKAKNFIDTALARGADMAGGWAHDGLAQLGLTLAGFGALGATVAAALAAMALAVGRGYRARAAV